MTEKRDSCNKYLVYNDSVRVFLIDATNMVKKAVTTHNLSNVAAAALGRTMMASTMISCMLKEKENRLTVQIKGDGPLGRIVVCGNNELKIKGYVDNPEVELELNSMGKLDVAKAIGKGHLNVIKDIGMKEPYVGYSQLVTSEIAEDFAYYFVTSEQTPSAVALGVLIGENGIVSKAGGYIIEPMPDCEDTVIDIIESITKSIKSISYLMTDIEDMDDVAKTITGDNEAKRIYQKEPIYECDCSEERIDKTIIALGKVESLKSLSQNNGELEVKCNFCNKTYKYNEKKIEEIFSK